MDDLDLRGDMNVDHVHYVAQGLLEVCQGRTKEEQEAALDGLSLAVAALARQVRRSHRFVISPEDAQDVFERALHDAACIPPVDEPVFEEAEAGTAP